MGGNATGANNFYFQSNQFNVEFYEASLLETIQDFFKCVSITDFYYIKNLKKMKKYIKERTDYAKLESKRKQKLQK